MAKNQQKRRRNLNVLFPLAGLNRRGPYRQQPPYSSPDLSNVRAMASIEGRERGGSRPGLMKVYTTDLGSNPRLLHPMVLALGDNWTVFSEVFDGGTLPAVWTQASWAAAAPSIFAGALASVDTSVDEGEAVLDALNIDTSSAYTVEAMIVPYEAAYHGKYRLYFRLDNTTPLITTDGVMVELTMTGTGGTYTATLDSYVSSVKTAVDTASGTVNPSKVGWLTATISGTTVDVYWHGTKILTGTVGAHTGARVGFGMACSVDGGLCLTNVFRVKYYSTASISGSRVVLAASAGGNLYHDATGAISQVSTSLSLRSDTLLTAAQSGQKLYIADYGDLRVSGTDGTVSGTDLDAASVSDWSALSISTHDDVVVISNVGGSTVAGTYKISSIAAGALTLSSAPGNGTCSYRVERAPKVYDPSAGTLAIHTASTGQVPTGCPIVFRFLDRIVYAGHDIAPHAWFMSRQGDPDDWDYAAEETDAQRAIAGASSEAGVPGIPITAGFAHTDDYAILACRTELHRLRGDPAYGSTRDIVSQTVGIIGPRAWCFGPAGELIFLSLDGLYVLPPGGTTTPIPLSREVLPDEFLNLNPETTTVLLEFDTHDHGVHIFLTPNSSNSKTHWWFDWDRKTFWPLTVAADHEPTSACSLQATAIEDSAVILGCRDGYLRRFSGLAETDDGTSVTSYAMLGPIPLAPDGFFGEILVMQGVLAADSGSVTWTVHPSSTFEGAVTASSIATGTWTEGLNANVHRSGLGQAAMLKLTNYANRKWAFEQATLTIQEAGPRRLS